jgi:hypothetical protein
MSATLIWIMCAVIVVALAAWLVAIALANRNPSFRHPHTEPRRGRVWGGTHQGGGRSVAPRRDAEVVPGEDPDKPTVPVRKPRGTSPMDL